MNILLIRHGHPEFNDKITVTKNNVATSIKDYANATVVQSPSTNPINTISNITVVLSSMLPRAISSATLLGYSDPISNELLNESELPYPDKLIAPLPWRVFVVLFRIAWFFGYSKNAAGKRADITRSEKCANYIQSFASSDKTVVVVGHGVMNRLIARSLKKQGWIKGDHNGTGYWSVISLSRTAT